MQKIIQASMLSMVVTLALSGCQKPAEQAMWPTTLAVFGDGFPHAGDACRRLGETAKTVNYLDDSASLVGCLSADDAARLGGKVVATIDGVTLVSVSSAAALPGDGDGQGDTKVAGTKYHATAQIRCSGYRDTPAGMCAAGVVRGTDTGTYIDVTLPNGRQRTIFFNGDGSFLTFSIAEADGTAALAIGSRREGDMTIATLGSERYEIPDVLVNGD